MGLEDKKCTEIRRRMQTIAEERRDIMNSGDRDKEDMEYHEKLGKQYDQAVEKFKRRSCGY